MIIMNILIISNLVAKSEKMNKVMVIGSHLDVLEFMQMAEMTYSHLTEEQSQLIFPTYSTFLGSLGLLLEHADLGAQDKLD
jgi:pantothenate kinase